MTKIDILLATYNGELYMEAQLSSIISQSFKEWNLIIHDDGSSDKTIQIINRYTKLDSRIILVSDGYTVHNPGKHFIYMLRFANAPFICFCDQDDIWLENKLQIMFDYINKQNNDIPQVAFSDAYLYHCDTNQIGGRLLSARPHDLKGALFINGGIHGAASIFNQKMRICIENPYKIITMHDHVLTLAGCSFGKISYINKKLYLYRQHSKNVTGNMSTNLVERMRKAFSFSTNNYTVSQSTMDSVRSFYKMHENLLTDEDAMLIKNFLELPNKNSITRFFLIIKHKYTLSNSYFHLWIKILTRKFLAV